MNTHFAIRLFHPVIDMIASGLSLYFSINVLFQKNIFKNSINLSLTMTLNFIFVFIFAILSLIFNAYLIIFWRPFEIIYDARILYISGFIPWIFINLNSIMEFFLCLDRCLALIFPFKYNSKMKILSVKLSVIGLFGMSAVVIYFNNLLPAFPTATSTTSCYFFNCLITANKNLIPAYTVYIKIIFVLSNLLGSIFLAVLIRCILSGQNEIVKRLNSTVLKMLLCTTFVELIPFIGGQTFFLVTGQQLPNFIGPYGFTVSTINVTLSSGIYYTAFKKNIFAPTKIPASVIINTLTLSNVR